MTIYGYADFIGELQSNLTSGPPPTAPKHVPHTPHIMSKHEGMGM
jgi:hypothetical protein